MENIEYGACFMKFWDAFPQNLPKKSNAIFSLENLSKIK